MTVVFVLAAALTAPTDAAVVGTIRVDGPAQSKAVSLEQEGELVKLGGDLVMELERLASARVEVIGTRVDSGLEVTSYRILDVGGGTVPLVGELVALGDSLGLRDGGGADPLSLPPRSRERLQPKVGAKLWVAGNKLVSGELKVLRYGVLRERPGQINKEKN